MQLGLRNRGSPSLCRSGVHRHGLLYGNDVYAISNCKLAEFNIFGGQAITVPLQNSEAMFVLLWHISLAVNRGRLVGGPLHRDGKSMHLQPSISAEPVGFPWHTSHGTAAGMLRRREDFKLELGILQSGHFLTVVACRGSAGVVGSVFR